MVRNARSMPKASSRIERIGAAACAVHEALETIRCSGLRSPSLSPMTTVMSGGSAGGEHRITLFAPCSKWRSSSARVRNFAVASITVSTPSSPHGMSPGFSPDSIWIVRPAALSSLSFSSVSGSGNRPRIVSNLRRYAKPAWSATSLTATSGMSSLLYRSRKRFLPIRPNPINPMPLGMRALLWQGVSLSLEPMPAVLPLL